MALATTLPSWDWEESKFTRARVFKWNQTLPEDTVPPGVGLLMLLIKNVFVSVTSETPHAKDVTYCTVPESLTFDLENLSSRDKMENLVRNALERTHQFSQDDVACLPSKISKYLDSNFRFSVETLSRTNAVAKTVIVVDILKTKVFVCDQVKGVVVGDKNHVYSYDDIVWTLRTHLKVSFFYCTKPIDSNEPIGLVQVPALRMFETCDGGGVSEEDTCAICLEELLVKQSQRSIKKTSCSHVFHGGCLARWLWRKQSCPMCRFQLQPP